MDTKRMMFDDPNPLNQHLVLYLIDYHTDCTDPAEVEAAQNNLEEVHDAFVDAMLSGDNSSSDEWSHGSRDIDDFTHGDLQMWPPNFVVLKEGTRS